MSVRVKAKVAVSKRAFDAAGLQAVRKDHLVAEEPLEIRLSAAGKTRSVAVTMRTPGQDFELAAGFLLSEGLVQQQGDIVSIDYCLASEAGASQRYNIVNVSLRASHLPDLATLERHFFVSSACGLCGKAALEGLERRGLEPLPEGFGVAAEMLVKLPERLRAAQGLFAQTGGLHAAALFNQAGELLALREDVGRHNALDKLLGWALLNAKLPLADCLLLVSGRASFELVQKALVARLPVFCAVSAPSSLAVKLAKRFNMTLVGFLRQGRGNVYCAEQRLVSV